MSQVIKIDPVTRVEGHGRVSIHLDDNGQVEQARFHVVEFRGFEKFSEPISIAVLAEAVNGIFILNSLINT